MKSPMFLRFARKTLRYLTDLGRFGACSRTQDCQGVYLIDTLGVSYTSSGNKR